MLKHQNAYDRALLQIRNRIGNLAGLVEERLCQAMSSLVQQDNILAGRILQGDDEVDSVVEALERDCLDLILLQQPTDSDLRFLSAATRIGREMERIADYACDIAELTLELKQKVPYFKPLVDLPRMGEMVADMLRQSIKVFLDQDLAGARRVVESDDPVDELFTALLQELTDYMKKGPEYVDQASRLLLVARYLERIGDHVVNIAEMVVFIATGERHPFKS